MNSKSRPSSTVDCHSAAHIAHQTLTPHIGENVLPTEAYAIEEFDLGASLFLFYFFGGAFPRLTAPYVKSKMVYNFYTDVAVIRNSSQLQLHEL